MDARAVAANASQADYSTFLTKRQFIIHGAESIPTRKGWKDMEEERREQILQMLRDHGCRITRQRKILLDIILEEECSCCKEIYYKAAKRDKNIGTATVYRMINTLEEIGVISRKNMYRVDSDATELPGCGRAFEDMGAEFSGCCSDECRENCRESISLVQAPKTGESVEYNNACVIELEDGTRLHLPRERYLTVVQAGLAACGYGGNQKIRRIEY